MVPVAVGKPVGENSGPDILFPILGLLLRCDGFDVRTQPPLVSILIERNGLGPELVAVGDDAVYIDRFGDLDRPESPVASDVNEFKIVARSHEYALARPVIRGAIIGTSIAIGLQ